MKRLISVFLVLLIMLISCSDTSVGEQLINNATEASVESQKQTEGDIIMTDTVASQPLNHENFKAMWLSQFDLENIYTTKGSQTAEKSFKSKIHRVLELVKQNGFNTVILQVRPYADSFYPSEYYPASKYVSGSYAKKLTYDPLPIIIEYAHSLDISIHAWINPIRGMMAEEVEKIDDSFLIKQWYNSRNEKLSYVSVVNDRLYLDPAYEETRALIVNGVKEILDNYNFDGIHMDDYFYPTTDGSFDKVSYNRYIENGGKDKLKQFRFNNINKLVADIYAAVKAKNNALLFGISPEGNIKNVTEKAFADVHTWMSEDGYIDYICPQIYYGLKHGSLPFDKTIKSWASLIKNKNVKLIAGMTFGKALSKTDQWAGSGKNEWAEHNDIMKRCLESTLNVDKMYGISVFCFQYYYDPLTFKEVTGTKQERDNFTPILKDANWN